MSWQPRKNAKNRAANKPRRLASTFQFESLERRQLLAADLVSVTPADNATGIDVDDNLVLTFASDVKAGPGAGRILIKNAADDSLIEAVSVDDTARVTFSGATVTVDPTKALPSDAKIYVTIDAGAIRDTASTKAAGVLFRENFETLPLSDSDLDSPTLDNYAAFLSGTLDVQTAGDYRFGTRNDDGGYLVIDLNGDGTLDPFDTEEAVIFDDSTHGLTDFFGAAPITLAKGQYKFEYMYFDAGGGSGGEFFYAPDDGKLGDPVVFDAEKFAVVGDASKGIGLTDAGVKVTTYAAATGSKVDTIQLALDIRDGFVDTAEDFPQSATIKTADVWEFGDKGYYSEDNLIPGYIQPPADDHDFSVDPPTGWVRDNSVDNARPEYNGWGFLDKEFWIAQQGDQQRTTWLTGEGVVAVMDPDAFDDFTDIDAEALEAYLTLPAIDLTDVTPNTVTIDFASSWRPYMEMTGLVDVSFDGGENWENLLTLDNADGDSSLARADEAISLTVANPSGGSMLVRFGMTNCNNDWWWAVDNIVVNGEAVGDLNEGIADRTTWNFATATGPVGLPGDFNADGKIDLTDFGILKTNFGTGTTLAQGDANGDAKVDLTDFGILKNNFGKTGAAIRAADYVFAVAATEAARAATAESTDSDTSDPFADKSVADELLV